MNTATRVSAFGAGLVVAFGAALGIGRLVGPLDSVSTPAPHMQTATDGPGTEVTDHGSTAHVPASPSDVGGSTP